MPASIPSPPPTVVEVKAPDDRVPALGAMLDIRRELEDRGFRLPEEERFFRVAGNVGFAEIASHYDAGLGGWRKLAAFPNRTQGGPTAMWTARGRAFVIVLIPHADRRREGGGPDQLLITFAPAG